MSDSSSEPAADQAGQDAAAASSPATDQGATKSFADTVAETLHQGGFANDDGASPSSGTSESKAEEGDSTEAKEADEAEEEAEEDPKAEEKGEESDDKQLPFHKHPRWQEMRKKASDAESRVKELEGKVQEAENAVEAYNRLSQFAEEHGLDDGDVNAAFEVAALVKSDPRAALEKLRPMYEEAAVAAGEMLPPDLDEAVENGEITEERAQELARYRLKERQSGQNAERERQTQQQRAVQDLASAVSDAERKLISSDPDYGAIKDVVHERFELWARRQGQLPDKQAALKELDKIVKSEKKRLGAASGRSTGSINPRRPSSASPRRPQPAQANDPVEHLTSVLMGD